MTISIAPRKAGPYIGNGASNSFAFAFKVFADTDLKVFKSDDLGIEITLTLGIDYSVALSPDQETSPGGQVVTSVPLIVGARLTIIGDMAVKQELALSNESGFYPSVFNPALDKLAIYSQQLKERADRALSFPISDGMDGVGQLPRSFERLGCVLGFDPELGQPIAGPSMEDIEKAIAYADGESGGDSGGGADELAIHYDYGNELPYVMSVDELGKFHVFMNGGTVRLPSNAPSGATVRIAAGYSPVTVMSAGVEPLILAGIGSGLPVPSYQVRGFAVGTYKRIVGNWVVTTDDAANVDYLTDRAHHQGMQPMASIADKKGKVLDDLTVINDYFAEIDDLKTDGGYIVSTDPVNGLFLGSTILVASIDGFVLQTVLIPAFSYVGVRYFAEGVWSNWQYSLSNGSVSNWYESTTAEASNAVINANGSFSRSTSSEEYKTGIEPMDAALADAIVQGAQPIYYRSLGEADPPEWSYWGISAEQLATVDARLVHWGHSTKEVPQPFGQAPKQVPDLDSPLKPVGVQYSRFVPALLSVVKRQGAAIAALEARLAVLEAKE